MTKIEFADEHLRVMMTALEVYSRLRAGQIRIAIDVAFRDMSLSWKELESIEEFVRGILYPQPPELKYDGHEEMIKSGGTLAYEIYSTLRQYVSLKNNDGYEGVGVNYRSPLQTTEVPLPRIEGFSTEKRFPIKGKAIVGKLDKAQETKDYTKVWDVVGEYLKRKYPELEGYSQAKIEREDNHYVVIVKGARKKKDEFGKF